jgi:hypothetical protein
MAESTDAIEIDGPIGEGEGQVLRSCLALSLITRKELRITNIRPRRRTWFDATNLNAVEAAGIRFMRQIGFDLQLYFSTGLRSQTSSIRRRIAIVTAWVRSFA